MSTSTLEKPQEIKSFTSLIHLREQLTKEAKNQERLTEFQKTIDEAIKDGDKRGVIEFTEKEWKTLITNENLPPFEEVQTLLKEKIKSRKEVTREAKEKTGGIMGELQNKTDEAKKALEEVKGKAQGAIKEALSPIQKIKENITKLGNSISETWSNIWTPVKFAWYTLWATLGFKFGRDALASMTKEKAEKIVEAAKKKAGELAGKGGEMIKEGKEGLVEKVGPLAALSTAGVGIFALLKDRLPGSITKNLTDIDQKSFLTRLAGNRALRLFGVSGVALFGIGKLYGYIEKNSATLGEMPTDTEGKKAWWKQAIEKAGLGAKEGAEELWAVLNGSKLEEYFEKDKPKDGYVFLQNHKTIQASKKQLLILEKRCEILYNEHKDFFNTTAAASLILKPGMMVGAGLKGTTVMLSLLQYTSPGLIIPAGLVVGLTNNAIEGLQHIQVPENIGPEDIADMINIPDIEGFLESHMPGVLEDLHLDNVAREFSTLEQKIKEFNAESFLKKIAGGLAEKLIQTEQEKINGSNDLGIQTIIKKLELAEIESGKKGSYTGLLGTKEAPGILRSLHLKMTTGQTLTEGDIRGIMEAAEGTNVRIFPRDESKSGTTIQWVMVDKHGNASGMPQNLCINPTIDHAEQYEAARDFVVNEYGITAMNVVGKAGSGFVEMVSELTESIKNNNEKSGSILESVFRNGGSIAAIGTETFIVDYLGNKYFLGPWNLVQGMFLKMQNPEDKLEMQEGLVEYGQGLAPVFVITATKNLASGHGLLGLKNRGFYNGLLKNSLVQSITYPLQMIKNVGKGSVVAGKYIWERALSGDYKAVFSDPKNQINAHFYEIKHGILSLKKLIPIKSLQEIGGIHHSVSKLEEARTLLYKAKQNTLWSGPNVSEALKILEGEGSRFSGKRKGDHVSSDQIRGLIDEVEDEINHEKHRLEYLEKGIRETFPQQLKNRTNIVDDLKKGPDMNTDEGKKQAHEAFEESKKEIEEMEKKRIQAEKDLIEAKKAHEAKPSDAQLKQEFETRRQTHTAMMANYHENHRDLSEIREAMGELLHGRKPRIKLGESHLRSIKGLRGSAKVLGILAATVGAGFGIEKISEYIHGDSHENHSTGESTSEGDERYFGFRKNNTQSATEQKEKSSDMCETPEEFSKRIEMIETQYTESTSKFLDPEWVQNIPSKEREKIIQEAADGHMLRVDAIKSLIRANKGMMEGFWNKQFTNEETGEEIIPNDIREQGVKAFMFIHKKGGKLTLDYMSHQDMKNVLYLLYDQNYKTWAEKNLGNGGAMVGDLALRVGMYTGSFMDGKDAYGSFSRGNIGDGLWSTAWCIGGLAIDIVSTAATFTGVGATVGVPLEGLTMSARGARIASAAGKALLHNGVQMGVQFGQALAKVPRSESIKIDDL